MLTSVRRFSTRSQASWMTRFRHSCCEVKKLAVARIPSQAPAVQGKLSIASRLTIHSIPHFLTIVLLAVARESRFDFYFSPVCRIESKFFLYSSSVLPADGHAFAPLKTRRPRGILPLAVPFECLVSRFPYQDRVSSAGPTALSLQSNMSVSIELRSACHSSCCSS